MPSLFKLTRDLESKLHALLAELQEVKNKARSLEQENMVLRKELAGLRGNSAGPIQPEQNLNLLELYDQGFHVCNMFFGEERVADCLFCMAFLRKEMDE